MHTLPDRYVTAHLAEDQYEPGSDGSVLRNLLGIIDPEELAIAETAELWRVQEKLIGEISGYQSFTAEDNYSAVSLSGLCGLCKRADFFVARYKPASFAVTLDQYSLNGRGCFNVTSQCDGSFASIHQVRVYFKQCLFHGQSIP